MKTLHLSVIMITGIVLIGINFSNVYAPCLQGIVSCGPPPGVTVSIGTDNGAYEKNETINVKGWIYLENYQKPVQIQIINPANLTIQNYQVPVDNSTFNLKINANFETTGLYRIVTCVNSWCDNAYFKFVAEPYRLSIDNKNFLINYKTTADLEKISADITTKSIRLHVVNATADAHKITIDLPRSIIDSKSQNNADMNFTVLVGELQPDKFMQNANFKEIATTSHSRTLQIDIPYDPIPDVQGIWDFKITGTTFLGDDTVSSPLEQLKSGISAKNVTCKETLQLVIKSEDGSPACIKPDNVSKLIEQGWTKEFIQSSDMISQSMCGSNEVPSGDYRANIFPVLMMPTNSTAKVCVTYNFNFDWQSYPNKQIYSHGILETCCFIFIEKSSTRTSSNQFEISSNLPLYNVTGVHNGTKVTVMYKIHAGSNSKGFYENSIPHGYCSSYPLAVGYDVSQINASDFSNTVNLLPPCFLSIYNVDSVKIVSDMSFKEVQFP